MTAASQACPIPDPNTTIESGTWLVGTEIQPGTYKAEYDGEHVCRSLRLRGFSGEDDDVIASVFSTNPGPIYVEIAPTDLAFLADESCGVWVLIEGI